MLFLNTIWLEKKDGLMFKWAMYGLMQLSGNVWNIKYTTQIVYLTTYTASILKGSYDRIMHPPQKVTAFRMP
jgi:hypothetical protein